MKPIRLIFRTRGSWTSWSASPFQHYICQNYGQEIPSISTTNIYRQRKRQLQIKKVTAIVGSEITDKQGD